MRRVDLTKNHLHQLIHSGSTSPAEASTLLGQCLDGSAITQSESEEGTHTLVTGQTGTGKTALVCGQIQQHILRGPAAGGMLVLDPLGAISQHLVDFLGYLSTGLKIQELTHPFKAVRVAAGKKREELASRLIYLPFGSKGVGGQRLSLLDFGPGFSRDDCVGATIRALETTVSSTMDEMRRLFQNLRCGLTVLAQQGKTILDLKTLLLMEGAELEGLISRLSSRFPGVNGTSYVHGYLRDFLAPTKGRERREAVSSTLNLLQPILSNPRLCEVFCSGPSTMDLRAGIEEGKITLVSAPPGGDFTTGRLACSLFLSACTSAIEKRPAGARDRGHGLFRIYADEFHTFCDMKWLSLQLSTVRNRGAAYNLITQSFFQHPLSDPELQTLAKGLRANTRTLICMSVTTPDARELAPEIFGVTGQMVARQRVRRSVNTGTSEARAFSSSVARSLGLSAGVSTTHTTSESHGQMEGQSTGTSTGSSTTTGFGITHTYGQQSSRTQGHGITLTTSQGETTVESSSTSDGQTEGESHGDFSGVSEAVPELLFSSVGGRRESDGQSDGVSLSVSRVETAARAYARAVSSSRGESRSTSVTHGQSSSRGHSQNVSRCLSELSSAMKSLSTTLTHSTSTSSGKSFSKTRSQTTGYGESHTRTWSRSESVERVTDYHSVAEEQTLLAQQLVSLKSREFFIKKPGGTVQRGRTIDLPLYPPTSFAGFDGKADLLDRCRPIAPHTPRRALPTSDPTLSFLKPEPEELE